MFVLLMLGSKADFTSAVTAWNGITSNVNFTTYFPSEDYDSYNINVDSAYDEDAWGGGYAAFATLFNVYGIRISDYMNDKGPYTSGRVTLNSNPLTFPSLTKDQKMGTITHEFGHILGLMHPQEQVGEQCANPSIMWHRTEPWGQFRREYLTEHDRFNVRAKYN